MDTKHCLNCRDKFERPAYLSRSNFKRRKYCTRTCGDAYRQLRAINKEKYEIEKPELERYEVIPNEMYNHDMSEVQGLSRLYLDNKINIDTLRIMELRMKGITL